MLAQMQAKCVGLLQQPILSAQDMHHASVRLAPSVLLLFEFCLLKYFKDFMQQWD